jgi:hypothetical protein
MKSYKQNYNYEHFRNRHIYYCMISAYINTLLRCLELVLYERINKCISHNADCVYGSRICQRTSHKRPWAIIMKTMK